MSFKIIPQLTPRQVARFWAKVRVKVGECWEWQSRDNYPYGKITLNYECFIASRVSYFLHYKIDPKELFVCHKCDNPRCVNPVHLFLGTPKANTLDMISKGRGNQAKGEAQANAKFTVEKILLIRKRYATEGITQTALAKEFNVNQSTIHSIVKGKNWKSI